MPNPNFLPVIGGGFDQDAAQQQGWANFNRGVEEANMGRLAQAQQTQNQYLQARAQLQQAAIDRDAAAQERGQLTDLGIARERAAVGENARQFDAKFQWTKDQQQRTIDQANNFALSAAPEVARAGAEQEQSQKDLLNAQAAYEKAAQEAGSLIPNGKAAYNRNAGFYVATKTLTPDEKLGLDAANAKLADLAPVLSAAKLSHAEKAKSFDEIRKEAMQWGLTVQKQGDQHALYNPQNGRWFKAPAAITTATTTAPVPQFNPPSQWFGGIPANVQSPIDNSALFAGPVPTGDQPYVVQPPTQPAKRVYNPQTGLIE